MSEAIEGLSRHRQAAALSAAAVIGLAASVYFGLGYAHYGRLAAVDLTAARRAEIANANLQDALARMRDQLGAANQALDAAQGRIAALSEESQKQLAISETAKADRVAQLTRALEQAQRELHLAEAQRVTLMARLGKASADSSEEQARQQQEWQRRVQQLTADRDKTASERDRLRARLGELATKPAIQPAQPASQPMAESHSAPAAAAVAPAAPAPAAAAPAAPAAVPQAAAPAAAAAPHAAAPPPSAASAAVTEGAASNGRLAQFERVLASAGVDVKHLFAELGVKEGLGGPFIPASGADAPNPERLAVLRTLAETLPLSAPMANYRETSPFGGRQDPFNGRPAFHPGVDLSAPYGTPVYATAPGTVTYAGYRSDYGKIVEIDHGHGIVTRYGHLARYVVSVGERVASGTHIGYEGSTGRSTGPHVIYEVDVNGEPQDPEKFLRLARLVRGAQQ